VPWTGCQEDVLTYVGATRSTTMAAMLLLRRQAA